MLLANSSKAAPRQSLSFLATGSLLPPTIPTRHVPAAIVKVKATAAVLSFEDGSSHTKPAREFRGMRESNSRPLSLPSASSSAASAPYRDRCSVVPGRLCRPLVATTRARELSAAMFVRGGCLPSRPSKKNSSESEEAKEGEFRRGFASLRGEERFCVRRSGGPAGAAGVQAGVAPSRTSCHGALRHSTQASHTAYTSVREVQKLPHRSAFRARPAGLLPNFHPRPGVPPPPSTDAGTGRRPRGAPRCFQGSSVANM